MNDYNGDLMNFWHVVRSDRLALLIGKIFLSVNGEEAFRENRELLRGRPNILDDCSEIAEHLKTATDEETSALEVTTTGESTADRTTTANETSQ